jgi:hypothetical protein
MKKLFLAAVAVLALLSTAAADNLYVCAPEVSGGATGPRTVGGANSPVPSQTLYSLNGQGCTRVTLQDYGYFLSQGYSQQSSQFATELNTGVQAGGTNTTNFTMPMPAKTYIQQIIFSNAVAAAVAGGVSVGTTANGTNIVAAQAVGASTDVAVAQAAILLPVPVTTGLAYTLNFAAVTGWNGANVTITVIAGYY